MPGPATRGLDASRIKRGRLTHSDGTEDRALIVRGIDDAVRSTNWPKAGVDLRAELACGWPFSEVAATLPTCKDRAGSRHERARSQDRTATEILLDTTTTGIISADGETNADHIVEMSKSVIPRRIEFT